MNVRHRVARHRAQMRGRGLRPVQIWVPDRRSPEFSAAVENQSRIIREFDASDDTLDFLQDVADWPDEADQR